MWKFLLLLGLLMPAAAVAAPVALLNIAVDSTGGAHVRAVLELPAKPVVVHAVLTDYAHWPLLFPSGLRIVAISQNNAGVETDVYVPRRFLPGEFHLITLTRETAPGILETSLIGGDFLQYRRTWILTPGLTSDATRAELEMDIQLKQWIPGWLFTLVLKHELLEHFGKLRAEVARNLAEAP
jgi:ribosome-associated toxin RatA of RatAB toxin-antitoxin module